MRDYTTENPSFSKKIRIVEESDLVNAENDAAASKQLLQNDLVLLARMEKCMGSAESGLELDEAIQADTLIGAVNEVFRLGSENKQKLVENLTAMGVAASTDDTWGTLLDKILDMTDTSKDTVTAAALLSGYTAHDAAGVKITGALADKSGTTDHRATASLDVTNQNLKLKVPTTAKYGAENYLYAAYSAVASLIGLTSAKLVRNNTILGITGSSGNMDTSGATAAAADILSGKKAGVNGGMVTGNMANRGAWTGATTGNGNVSIPAGYHNGSGYVSGAGAYNKGVSDADGRVNTGSTNYRTGYNAGVSATKVGTAGTGDVLAGKTFTNTGSVGASGTMANKGGATVDARAVTQDDTYTYLTVPANGYYNTSSRLKAANGDIAGVIRQKSISLVSFMGTLHTSKNDTSVVCSDNPSVYCFVKGTATIVVKTNQAGSLKYIESFQPNISSSAGVGGASTFSVFGSNDNQVWEEIPIWVACERGTETGWFNAAVTAHIVRLGNSDYNAKKFLYYKFVMKSAREWLCVGTQRLFF